MSTKNSTEAERQKGPCNEPGEVGISANVLRELDSKVHPTIAAKIRAELAKKGG